MTPDQRKQLWQQMTPEERARVWSRLPPEQRQAIRERLTPEQRQSLHEGGFGPAGPRAPGPAPKGGVGPAAPPPPGPAPKLSPEERRRLRDEIRAAHRDLRRGRGGRP